MFQGPVPVWPRSATSDGFVDAEPPALLSRPMSEYTRTRTESIPEGSRDFRVRFFGNWSFRGGGLAGGLSGPVVAVRGEAG